MNVSSASESETLDATDILQDLVAVFDELLPPMHYLNDLRAVWDKLTKEEREEITSSRVHREKDHEKRIKAGLTELEELADRLRGFKFRRVRKSIRQYITHWKTFEPDQVKILQAKIRLLLK